MPILDGKWWQIAPTLPDVGDLKTGEENACDFALFQAKDGSWRVISCIRGTKAPGQRIFYVSDDPLDLTMPPVVHMTGLWFSGKYAPEIVEKDGQWYVAGYFARAPRREVQVGAEDAGRPRGVAREVGKPICVTRSRRDSSVKRQGRRQPTRRRVEPPL